MNSMTDVVLDIDEQSWDQSKNLYIVRNTFIDTCERSPPGALRRVASDPSFRKNADMVVLNEMLAQNVHVPCASPSSCWTRDLSPVIEHRGMSEEPSSHQPPRTAAARRRFRRRRAAEHKKLEEMPLGDSKDATKTFETMQGKFCDVRGCMGDGCDAPRPARPCEMRHEKRVTEIYHERVVPAWDSATQELQHGHPKTNCAGRASRNGLAPATAIFAELGQSHNHGSGSSFYHQNTATWQVERDGSQQDSWKSALALANKDSRPLLQHTWPHKGAARQVRSACGDSIARLREAQGCHPKLVTTSPHHLMLSQLLA